MRLGAIALELRAANTHFGNFVGGSVDLGEALSHPLTREMAFVIPLLESATDNKNESSPFQWLTERFAILVALENDRSAMDKLGLGAYDQLHDIRGQLLHTLVGWDLGYETNIIYRGGKLLDINNAWLWYQFEFEYNSVIRGDESGFGEVVSRTVLERKHTSELPDLNEIYDQYILKPSNKWADIEAIVKDGGKHLPLAATQIDAAQFVDLSKPYIGGFSGGFASQFDIYRVNR